MSDIQQEDRRLLEAAKLLLSDVRRQREEMTADLDRKERDLQGDVARYRKRLGLVEDESLEEQRPPYLFSPNGRSDDHDDENAADSYGVIGETVMEIVRANSKSSKIADVAAAMKARGTKIKAKSYESAARTAVRRLIEQGDIIRVREGLFRPKERTEAQHS
jgi:hypothetical protein